MLYCIRFWVHYISYIASLKPLISFWRVVRVVDRAALEMPCPLPDPGFESRTLRHQRHKLCIACDDFFQISFCSVLCNIFFIHASTDCDNQIFIAHLLCNGVCSCSFNAEQFHNFGFCYLPVLGNEIKNLFLLRS